MARRQSPRVPTPPEFLRAASKPRNWLLSVDDLLNAADNIWQLADRQRRGGRRLKSGLVVKRLVRPVSHRTALMLYGYAVEGALKALRVKQMTAAGVPVNAAVIHNRYAHAPLASTTRSDRQSIRRKHY